MGLTERITEAQHAKHLADKVAVEGCPLCRVAKDLRPSWMVNLRAKELTTAR